MSAFVNHFSFEFRTGIRNRTLLLLTYLLPLAFYALMGLLMTEINPLFTETLIPAMVVLAILFSTLLAMPDPLVTAREDGIFRSYKINGVPASSILVIPAVTTILHLVIVATIISVTASMFFDAPMPVDWPAFGLVFLLTAFALSAIGVLIGVISSNTTITVLWAQAVFLPSMLLGGLMFPFSMLPEALARLAILLPSTLAMNAFRGLTMGLAVDFDPIWSLIVLLSGGVVALGLAIYLFNWDSQNKTSRGHPLMALGVLIPFVVGAFLLS